MSNSLMNCYIYELAQGHKISVPSKNFVLLDEIFALIRRRDWIEKRIFILEIIFNVLISW